MKKFLLATVLGLSVQGVAMADDGAARCNQVRDQIRTGVHVQVELEAIDLFNADQRQSHVIAFQLIPSVFYPCENRGPDNWIFQIGKDVQLKTSRATYSGVWETGYPHVQVTDTSIVLNGEKLTAYHAVFASIMLELGYDSFESATGTPFPALGDHWFGGVPSNSPTSSLVGVAGTNGRLFQVMVKRIMIGALN